MALNTQHLSVTTDRQQFDPESRWRSEVAGRWADQCGHTDLARYFVLSFSVPTLTTQKPRS